jgi:hypothetical protein
MCRPIHPGKRARCSSILRRLELSAATLSASLRQLTALFEAVREMDDFGQNEASTEISRQRMIHVEHMLNWLVPEVGVEPTRF